MIGKYVTNTYEIKDAYQNIILNLKDAKVNIEPSDNDSTKVVFFEKKRRPYEVLVQDGALTIKPKKAKWYNFLRIGIDRSEIKVYVPKSALDGISVKSNVGRVSISSINCSGTIDIQTNTGKIDLENVSCEIFESKGNCGHTTLGGLIAKKSISIKRNTGKVLLNNCSAPEIFVKTNTGRVGGQLPSNTVFVIRTNTGKIEIPKAPIGEAIGGRCEIKTNTGNIKFE